MCLVEILMLLIWWFCKLEFCINLFVKWLGGFWNILLYEGYFKGCLDFLCFVKLFILVCILVILLGVKVNVVFNIIKCFFWIMLLW